MLDMFRPPPLMGRKTRQMPMPAASSSAANRGNMGAHGGGSVLRPHSAVRAAHCWLQAARKRVLFAPASERATAAEQASAAASVIVSSVLLAKNYDKDL